MSGNDGRDPVHALATDIAALRDWVRDLADELHGGPVGAARPLPAWNWTGLRPERLREAWLDLGSWVDWLIRVYRLEDRWPTCWYLHSDVVQWVLGLRSWHRAAWAPHVRWEPGSREGAFTPARARDFVEWHVYGLRVVLAQCLELTAVCDGGRHHAERGRSAERAQTIRREAMARDFAGFLVHEVPTTAAHAVGALPCALDNANDHEL